MIMTINMTMIASMTTTMTTTTLTIATTILYVLAAWGNSPTTCMCRLLGAK